MIIIFSILGNMLQILNHILPPSMEIKWCIFARNASFVDFFLDVGVCDEYFIVRYIVNYR